MVKRWLLALVFITTSLTAQTTFPSYYQETGWSGLPTLLLPGGLQGMVNPAQAYWADGGLMGFWQQYYLPQGNTTVARQNWLLISGLRGFSLASGQLNATPDNQYRFFQVALATGTAHLSYGIAYQWFTGPTDFKPAVKLGFISRPSRHLSFGLHTTWQLDAKEHQWVVEGGFRPLGSPVLTLGGDVQVTKPTGADQLDFQYSVAALLQPVTGMGIWARYLATDDPTVTVGLSLNFGYTGLAGHFSGTRNTPSDQYTRTASIRIGKYIAPSLDQVFLKEVAYTAIHLKGSVAYLDYEWFPRSPTPRFLEVLRTIEAAGHDPRIALLALNLSGAVLSPEMAWEIRRELQRLQQQGKKVLVYIDNASLTLYHLASVADYLLMDPNGQIEMLGLALSRTYFKHTLEKLGLGFEEHRYFKYKSALESYARDHMSQADSLQLQAYLNDWYNLIRQEISEGRDLSPEQFDALVNEKALLLAQEAFQLQLVDTLKRWSAVEDWLRHNVDKGLKYLPPRMVLDAADDETPWGPRPKIAVVYGLGVCAMDEGIRARYLERVFLALRNRADVAAVVFRVDSPGGDPMASDVVAQAIQQCRENKPVVISQGQVAASGGYWISMNGDKIVAGPNTVTGSIGVIGGWLWDNGFADRLGMSSDHVQVGTHADLTVGVRLPLLGIQIPTRNLTADEKNRLKSIYLSIYDEFVAKVSRGRHIPEKQVRQIAEGRIYSGIAGQEVQLVDTIGTLLDAIREAKHLAGIAPDQPVTLVEYPKSLGKIRLPSLSLGIHNQLTTDPSLQLVQFLARHNGKPLPLLLPGYYPEVK